MVAQVITIAQQKGGAGKTTLAAHLAVAWAQLGIDVALLDIDPQGSLTQWYRVREKLDENLVPIAFCTASGWRISNEITRLAREHQLLVIDSPPHTEAETRSAIRAADLVIVPMQPSPLDLWATQATLKLAKEERKKVKMVLNRVSPNTLMSRAMMDEIISLSPHRCGNRVIYAGALMAGKGVTEIAPYSAAGEEVEKIARDMAKYLKIPCRRELALTA